MWLGEVATAGVPGRSKTLTPQTVRLSEWAIAYFMELPLNTKLRTKKPPRPVTVLSRWWHRDFETNYKHRPHDAWPDLIDYLDEGFQSRLVWFGSSGRVREVYP